eukprot:CAMPEP_0181071956 /NCGR_PEP_ID=MMETSP1070-20121207/28320_1 /TAXON_ID=265543 /ORGANISM="Minutocellus polymorphus, Strain NH13" /LENGTH=1062 /DNA_ID=CAMNT_0023152991 /DNA_START=266 /DNA_END=3454 /DNA_ORIENTATION=-
MRSRSSRLFIVLIHLVGVSTNLPHNAWSNTPFWQGIRGVHPMAIFLESLHLPPGADGGLDELLSRLRRAGYDFPEDDVLNEPFWLQDDADGLCLGPGGTFGQCGDASLWLVRKRRRRRRDGRSIISRLILRTNGDGDDDDAASVWGYALELVDVSAGRRSRVDSSGSAEGDAVAHRIDYSEEDGECLVSRPASFDADQEGSLRLGSCASNEAWVWRISGDGVLSQDERAVNLSLTRKQRQQQISQRRQHQQQRQIERPAYNDDRQTIIQGPADPLRRLLLDSAPQIVPSGVDTDSSLLLDEGIRANCIWRVNASMATSTQCAKDESKSNEAPAQSDKRLVNFSLIRYQTSTDSARLPRLPEELQEESSSTLATEVSSDNDGASKPTDGCPPSDDDNSSPQACQSQQASETTPVQEDIVVPAMFPELKPASQLLFGTPSPSAIKTKRPTPSRPAKAASASFSSHMVGASPLTLGAVAYPRSSKLGAGLPGRAAASSLVGPDANRNILHYPPSQSSVQSPIPHGDAPHKVRKIPKHPYIEASNDGIWVDGDTGLEYPTDLSDYLGHDRKETGRHTLMGVGQYTRTVFKIKVYGCALYVSKRDSLADPGFEPFAALPSEDLRTNEEFYSHLMTNEPTNGAFDRTLFIKINMQLATETMRQSLDADWKLLTPEHKNALISSSLNPRDAEERMLQKIQSDDNPSRCSCGQNAPEEYRADPSCCARGTELVFTWKKGGNLELRVDERVMDTFTDPELGRGIFYEYLRGDEPMSMDARDKFSDGFPFLLAPLAQVRGVSSSNLPHDAGDERRKMPKRLDKKVLRAVGSATDFVGSQMSQAADWAQSSAEEMRSNSLNAAKGLADSAQKLTTELERRRVMAWEDMMGAPQEASRILASRVPFLAPHLARFVKEEDHDEDTIDESDHAQYESTPNRISGDSRRRPPRGRVFRPRKEETDEIGVIKDPSMNFTHRLFLYMVHCYLMLLLIVSVPGSYSTRLVVKRVGGSRSKSLSDDEEELSSGDDDQCYYKGVSRKGRDTPELQGMEVSLKVSDPAENISSGMTKSLSYYL